MKSESYQNLWFQYVPAPGVSSDQSVLIHTRLCWHWAVNNVFKLWSRTQNNCSNVLIPNPNGVPPKKWNNEQTILNTSDPCHLFVSIRILPTVFFIYNSLLMRQGPPRKASSLLRQPHQPQNACKAHGFWMALVFKSTSTVQLCNTYVKEKTPVKMPHRGGFQLFNFKASYVWYTACAAKSVVSF